MERKTQGEVCKDQTTQGLPRTGRSRSLCKPCLDVALDGCSEGGRDQQLQQCNGEKREIILEERYRIWGSAQDKFVRGLLSTERSPGGHSEH